MIFHTTYSPQDILPSDIVLPDQVHSDRIVEVISGKEDLTATDGVWTRNNRFCLAVQTADCAPIVFSSDECFGVIHAGWRGVRDGIIERMIGIFAENLSAGSTYNVWIGPFMHEFEIKRDDCFVLLREKFGTQFFSDLEDGRMIFDFRGAILSLFPETTTVTTDSRNTLDDSFVSWRRDHTDLRNVTVVRR